MMPELVHESSRLSRRLASNCTRVSPLKWKILKEQHSKFVGLLIQVRVSNVTVYANQIQVRVLSEHEITSVVTFGDL